MADFSLAGLLRLRKLKEERAAAELAAHRSRASQLAAERHQLIDTLSDHGHDARDVQGIAALSAARASATAMLAELDAMRAAQLDLAAAAERVHGDARRDTRTVEKLEERHVERRRTAELRAEQLVIDELASRTKDGGRSDAGTDAEAQPEGEGTR